MTCTGFNHLEELTHGKGVPRLRGCHLLWRREAPDRRALLAVLLSARCVEQRGDVAGRPDTERGPRPRLYGGKARAIESEGRVLAGWIDPGVRRDLGAHCQQGPHVASVAQGGQVHPRCFPLLRLAPTVHNGGRRRCLFVERRGWRGR